MASDPPIVGHCDGVSGGLVRGWAWQPGSPGKPVEIELLCDDEVVARASAAIYRQDLLQAGIGNGYHGFEIAFPDVSENHPPSVVVVRAVGEESLPSGVFRYADLVLKADLTIVQGHCDGMLGGRVRGWAWYPARPETPVEVEVRINGISVERVVATKYRGDLRRAGIGDGRYGFEVALPSSVAVRRTSEISVVVPDGHALTGGVFTYNLGPTEEDLVDPDLRSFVETVIEMLPSRSPPDLERRRNHFFVFTPDLPSYDGEILPKARDALRPVFARLGEIHDIGDLIVADDLAEGIFLAGESVIMLSFSPPSLAPVGRNYPVIPVFALEVSSDFAKIPVDDEWCLGLRRAGRAIVLSRFAANVVRTVMGATYPVIDIIPPVDSSMLPPPAFQSLIELPGPMLDTRMEVFSLTDPLPAMVAEDHVHKSVSLSGVVFTSVVKFDGDEDTEWEPIVDAFATAHRNVDDATLLVLMQGAEPGWWRAVSERLGRLPSFACRIIFSHLKIEDPSLLPFIAATHWVVDGARSRRTGGPIAAFMAAGRPAIAPIHTALADYVMPATGIPIVSDEVPAPLPDCRDGPLVTTINRMRWSALVEAFREAYRMARFDPESYQQRSESARQLVLELCDEDNLAQALDSFLGLRRLSRFSSVAASRIP